MRHASTSAAILVLAAALRDEIGRLELEVEGSEEVHRKNEVHLGPAAQAFIDVAVSARENLSLEEGTGDPAYSEGTVEIMSQESCTNGMLHVKGTAMVKEELIFSKDCTIHGERGSQVILEGPLVFKGVLRIEGDLRFTATHALQRPCVTVEKHAFILGNVRFQNCHNEKEGGKTRRARRRDEQPEGGGLYGKLLTLENGTVEFHNCTSKSGGGGLYVNNEMYQRGGTMKFHSCSSKSQGGGLYGKQWSLENGTVEFHNCTSKSGGGGLYIKNEMHQQGGTMKFHSCSSEYGGGMFVRNTYDISDGAASFNHCTAAQYGGGMYVKNKVWQQGGIMNFHSCSSKSQGGGLYVDHEMSQQGGTSTFHNCSSQDGGGMSVRGTYNFSDGAAAFNHCAASLDGGGLWVGRFWQREAPEAAAGVLPFHHCSATRGGGIFAVHAVHAMQPMQFLQCTAAKSGGGIQIIQITGMEGSALAGVHFENCSAAKAAAISVRNLTVQKLELVNTFGTTISAESLKVGAATFQVPAGLKPTIGMESGTIELGSDLDCTQLKECPLWVPDLSQLTIPKLHCGPGAGVADTLPFGCVACTEGYTQVENTTTGACLQCPTGADVCHAATIKMKPGLMLHKKNLSRPLHCPTKKVACPGGELPVTRSSRPMCKAGYGGEGCAKCVEDNGPVYLMSDANVLACTQCAKGTFQHLLQWSSFLGQRAVLFAVSAASIFGAGNADRVKSSGVYLNQLMAFASVSGSVVTAVMQTETAQMMKSATVKYVYGTAIFISEASSGQGAKSSHCLLFYLSLEQSGLFGVTCLDIVVATLLVLILSFKDWRVSLVAGLNCFLPGIMADFAKHAVCYRLEEDQTGGMENLICNHLPFSNFLGFVTVGTSFLAVFAVALFVWIRLSTSHQEGVVLSHVAFLTNKYGEGRRYFEAERLVRKVLLDTAAAIFPSTTFPQLQMTALTVVTCASMVLYGIFQPYNRQLWNWSELGLLGTALVLISLASAVMANEEQWDKTETGQLSIVITLGMIVTSVCVPFMIKIALEMWRERQGQAAPSDTA